MPAVAGASSTAAVSIAIVTETSGVRIVEAEGVAEGDDEGEPPAADAVVEGEAVLDGDARFEGVDDG